MSQRLRPRREARVALPVYGARVLPRFCLARRFCVAASDRATGTARIVEDRVWDPVESPSLARWLRDLGVSGVVCGGIHPRHRVALENEGLWVAWGYRGEVEQALANWWEGRPGEPRVRHCLRLRCPHPEPKGETP